MVVKRGEQMAETGEEVLLTWDLGHRRVVNLRVVGRRGGSGGGRGDDKGVGIKRGGVQSIKVAKVDPAHVVRVLRGQRRRGWVC